MYATSAAAARRQGRAMSAQLTRVNTPATLEEALDRITELENLIAVQRDQIKRLLREVRPGDAPVINPEQWVSQAQYAEHWRVPAYSVSRWKTAGKLPTMTIEGRERVLLTCTPPKGRQKRAA